MEHNLILERALADRRRDGQALLVAVIATFGMSLLYAAAADGGIARIPSGSGLIGATFGVFVALLAGWFGFYRVFKLPVRLLAWATCGVKLYEIAGGPGGLFGDKLGMVARMAVLVSIVAMTTQVVTTLRRHAQHRT